MRTASGRRITRSRRGSRQRWGKRVAELAGAPAVQTRRGGGKGVYPSKSAQLRSPRGTTCARARGRLSSSTSESSSASGGKEKEGVASTKRLRSERFGGKTEIVDGEKKTR